MGKIKLFRHINDYFLAPYENHSIEIRKRINLLVHFNFIGLLLFSLLIVLRIFNTFNIYLLCGDIFLLLFLISSLYFIKKKKLYYATTVICFLPISVLLYNVIENIKLGIPLTNDSLFATLSFLIFGLLFLSLFALKNFQLILFTILSFVTINIHYYALIKTTYHGIINSENITFYIAAILALFCCYIIALLVIRLFREMLDIIKGSLKVSEQKYSSLFSNMMDSFCHLKAIKGKDDQVIDVTFLEVNAAFEKFTKEHWNNVIGKNLSQLPDIQGFDKKSFLKKIKNIAFSGEDLKKELFFPSMNKWLDIYIYCPQIGFFVVIIKDITDRKRNEIALQRRDSIMESLAVIAGQMLSSSDLPSVIKGIIENIGISNNVSRCYIFENSTNEQGQLVTSQRYEWVAEGIEPQIDNPILQNLPYHEFAMNLFNAIHYGDVFYGNVANMEGMEREILEHQSIKSLAIVPIQIEDNWWGFIGLDDCINEREWSTLEIDALRLVANTIGASIQRKTFETKLQLAKEKAEELDKLKTSFLANLSHEIRTPMNAIIGFSNMLADTGLSVNDRKEYIALIKNSGINLMNLINDIIDISKIEAGQLELERSDLQLSDLLNEILAIFNREKIEKEKQLIEIILELPPKEIDIFNTDMVRLKQIFVNLLGNALKFTDKGYIKFGYQLEENSVKFFVSDTGIGIPQDKQNLIFDRFQQVDNSYTREYGGTGLGLTISRKLVEMMGGYIFLESETGKGSTFFFTLPLNNVTYKTTEISMEKKNLPWQGIVILVAEDVESNYLYLNKILSKKGATVLWAKNGQEAVDIFKTQIEKQPIDVILMDIQMPLMNGYQATKLIKEINPDVPIIAQTAFALENDREKTLAAGCDDYISKPIKPDDLTNILVKYINQ